MPRYRKSPIHQASCEVGFTRTGTWDPAVPGLIFSGLGDALPVRGTVSELSVGAQPTGTPKIQHAVQALFQSPDRRDWLRVGQFQVTIGRNAPYTSWADFSDRILIGVNAAVNAVTVPGIRWIALRYENRFEFEANAKVRLEDYFNMHPSVGPGFDDTHGAFIIGLQYPCNEGRDSFRVELGSAATTKTDRSAISLELEYSLVAPAELDVTLLREWLDSAHGVVYRHFEAAITDRVRAEMEPEIAGA